MKAFYQLLQTRRKTKLQAIIAVARKLLHAIFGIFKTNTAWDGAKLFPQLIIHFIEGLYPNQPKTACKLTENLPAGLKEATHPSGGWVGTRLTNAGILRLRLRMTS
jgi:hypothetical protein